MNVETGEAYVSCIEILAVGKLMEYNTFANFTQLFLGEYHIDNCAHDLHHLVVAIDVQMALVALTLCYHTYHPYYAQHVVSMGVGNEQMMDVRNGETDFAQLGENAVSSARIHQQQSAGSLEQKTAGCHQFASCHSLDFPS